MRCRITNHESLITQLWCNEHFIARRLQLGGKAFGVLADRKGAYLYLVQGARLGHVRVKPFFAELGRPGLRVFPGDIGADLHTIEHPRLAPGLSRWRRGARSEEHTSELQSRQY